MYWDCRREGRGDEKGRRRVWWKYGDRQEGGLNHS